MRMSGYLGEAYYVDNNPLTSLDGIEKSVIEYGIDAHNSHAVL